MQILSDLVFSLNQHMPLSMFVLLGGILEEVIAPIPSPLIMTFAGVASKELGRNMSWILWYGILGGVGKTFGAVVLYLLSDRFEDFFTKTFGRFFGIKPKHFETYGKKLAKNPNLFWWLFGVRAFPIAPSAVISVLSGVLKVPFKTYLLSTLFGCIIRDTVYVFVGYSANDFYLSVMDGVMSLDKIFTLIVALSIFSYFVYLAKFRKSKSNSQV
jgi:membrane protein DedA with SNARE-associated domain